MKYIKISGKSYKFTISLNYKEEIVEVQIEQLDRRAGGVIYPSKNNEKLYEVLNRVLEESDKSSEWHFLNKYRDSEVSKDKEQQLLIEKIQKIYKLSNDCIIFGGSYYEVSEEIKKSLPKAII